MVVMSAKRVSEISVLRFLPVGSSGASRGGEVSTARDEDDGVAERDSRCLRAFDGRHLRTASTDARHG